MDSVHGVTKRLSDFHFTSLQDNGGDVIPVELFKILKDVGWRAALNMLANFPQDWKKLVFILILKKSSSKEYTNYYTAVLILCAISLCSKPNRLQQYMNQELPDVRAGFRKGRGSRDQIANIHWIIEKAKDSRKTSTSATLTMLKSLTVWLTTNCGKFLKRCEHLTCHLVPSPRGK